MRIGNNNFMDSMAFDMVGHYTWGIGLVLCNILRNSVHVINIELKIWNRIINVLDVVMVWQTIM